MLTLTGGPNPTGAIWFDPDSAGLAAVKWGNFGHRWRFDAPSAPSVGWCEPPPVTGPIVRDCGRQAGHQYRLKDRWFRLPVGVRPQHAIPLPDGRRFAALEWDRRPDRPTAAFVVRSLTDGAVLWSMPTRLVLHRRLTAVPLSNRVVATAGGRLVVFDCDAGTAAEFPGRGRRMFKPAAAHPAGRLVLAVNNSPEVFVFDPHAVTLTARLDPGVGPLRAVAVSPCGLLAAAAGSRGRVAVWDV
jgi:hypothetical protein